MPLSIAFQMDPLGGIAIRGDTTFALMLEAQRRGHALFYYEPAALGLRDGAPFAHARPVNVKDEQGAHYSLGDAKTTPVARFDVVFLRQDPPFDMAYLTTTYLLERVRATTLVVNDPTEVRNAPEKVFVTDFPDLTPPTLMTRSLEDLKAFRREFGDVIVKPLYGNGGAGVFRLAAGDANAAALVEMFQAAFREPFIVQQYLPDVRAGDKRILLVEGEPVGAINRVPAPDETRSNMHAGGRPEPSPLTDRDREICAAIGPELRRRGLILVGIDVIGGRLTEINVTSPTGVREVARFGGADIAALTLDAVEARLERLRAA
ncbi:MAG: glutathione synthase [Hyphomicrobiales bacterium]|nr:glutathione synthase [Hyphomicrobiales bacterium]